MADEGHNRKTKEYWTTVNGKRIYSHDMEALCRTVAHGWSLQKEKMICIYCGNESYMLHEACQCFYTKGNLSKRLEAKRRLEEIMLLQKAKEKQEKAKEEKPKSDSSIIVP